MSADLPADITDCEMLDLRDATDQLIRKMRELGIPSSMYIAVITHVVSRRKVGGFLTAVLENNLGEAVSRADPDNYESLREWVQLLYNYFPADCWGSPEKVAAWLAARDDDADRKTT